MVRILSVVPPWCYGEQRAGWRTKSMNSTHSGGRGAVDRPREPRCRPDGDVGLTYYTTPSGLRLGHGEEKRAAAARGPYGSRRGESVSRLLRGGGMTPLAASRTIGRRPTEPVVSRSPERRACYEFRQLWRACAGGSAPSPPPSGHPAP